MVAHLRKLFPVVVGAQLLLALGWIFDLPRCRHCASLVTAFVGLDHREDRHLVHLHKRSNRTIRILGAIRMFVLAVKVF